jgi:ProP effector
VSGDSKRKRAEQAKSIITCFADLFPAAFKVYQSGRWPLKIGIDRDLAAALAGAVGDAEIHIALGYYTHNFGYLAACRQGAARLDLDGKVVGHVTADEAAHAAEVLAQHKVRPARPRSTTISTDSVKRITFADLKTAAKARKAVAS